MASNYGRCDTTLSTSPRETPSSWAPRNVEVTDVKQPTRRSEPLPSRRRCVTWLHFSVWVGVGSVCRIYWEGWGGGEIKIYRELEQLERSQQESGITEFRGRPRHGPPLIYESQKEACPRIMERAICSSCVHNRPGPAICTQLIVRVPDRQRMIRLRDVYGVFAEPHGSRHFKISCPKHSGVTVVTHYIHACFSIFHVFFCCNNLTKKERLSLQKE